jgi:hypothetical protein
MSKTAVGPAADVVHADFSEFLKQINRGLAQHELCEALEKVTAAVKDTGKAGTFALKITVTPARRGEVNQVFVDADVITKVPRKDRKQTIFFTTRQNTLVRNNPDQTEMPFAGEEK